MKRSLNIPAMLALMFTFGSSHAAGYFGASVGSTSPDDDGFDDSNGYRITLGYDVNPNISIEGSYTNLGEFDADDDLISALEFVTGVALDDVSVDVDGIELAVVGKVPLSDTVTFFGKAGIFMWDADFKIDTVSSGSDTETDDGSDPFFGFGVGFDVSKALVLNLEYNAYEASEGDVDYFGASANIKF